MVRSLRLLSLALLALAAALAVGGAWLAAGLIERRSAEAVGTALAAAGIDWAVVNADGLRLHLAGEAPSEAARFDALSRAGRVIEARRVIDDITVPPADPLAPPRFSIEILRNGAELSLIGLGPDTLDRAALREDLRRLAPGMQLTDFLETADFPAPPGWAPALSYGLEALGRLGRARISISPGAVAITALGDTPADRLRLEAALTRAQPPGVALTLDIRAPRPVITPFTLRFVRENGVGRFDACSAETAEDRARILTAATAAGLQTEAPCLLGLGAPSPDWPAAVARSLAALTRIGAGTVSLADGDIALHAAPDTDPAVFDHEVGVLESTLPPGFSLRATLGSPDPDGNASPDSAAPQFRARLDPEQGVTLSGRLPSTLVQETVTSVARARFGAGRVEMGARVGPDLPHDWTARVLVGLAALDLLHEGTLVIDAQALRLSGQSGSRATSDAVTQLLAAELGQQAAVALDIRYDPALDPAAALPDPQTCMDRIGAILTGQKITFAPGSTTVEGGSATIVDQIAEVLRGPCGKVDLPLLIAGYTDSQGREEMNLALSRSRALAVRDALAARRVSVVRIEAEGFGEADPIADNATEEGREANRRIEFRLRPQDPAPEPDSATQESPE